MKKLILLACLIFSTPLVHCDPAGLQQAFNKIADNCKGAVVNIKTKQQQYFVGPEFYLYGYPSREVYSKPVEGMGSGVIISEDGKIITNSHVINDADSIEVTVYTEKSDEKTYPAQLVWADKIMDIAMVKITDEKVKLPFLKFSDSSKVKAGDWSIAIGYPFGLKQTMTVGIVSSPSQEVYIQDRHYKDLIQTDTAINQGNSGGPLLNINGDIIGLNTAIYSPSGAFAGIGFAISANTIKELIDAYSETAAPKPVLGISLSLLTPQLIYKWQLPLKNGIIVAETVKGLPADKAGIKRGDIITEINGEKVMMPLDISSVMRKNPAGTEFTLKVFSGGKEKMVKLRSAAPESAQKQQKPQNKQEDRHGLLWSGITFADNENGVFISSVSSESNFYANFDINDRITAVNGVPVKNIQTLKTVLEKLNLKKPNIFDIIRANTPVKVYLEPVYRQL